MNIKKMIAVLFAVAIGFILIACDNVDKVELSVVNEQTTIVIGSGRVEFQTHVNGRINTGVNYVIIAGSEFASITNGVLSVNTSAPSNTEIMVKSTYKNIDSNVIKIIAIEEVKLTSITFDQTNQTLKTGESVLLTYSLSPQNTTETDVELSITKGSDSATLDGNKLTINNNALNNEVVEVTASREAISTKITFSVAALEQINISFYEESAGFFEPGSTVRFKASFVHESFNDSNLTWEIVNGYEKAEFESGFLFIGNDALVNDKIEVVAKVGNITSNKLTITIGNPDRSYIISANDAFTIYKPNSTENVFTFDLYDADFNLLSEQDILDLGIEFAYNIVGQDNVAEIKLEKPLEVSLDVLSHGQTTLSISVVGSFSDKTVTINAVNTPEKIDFNKVFLEDGRQLGIDYSLANKLNFGIDLGGEQYSNALLVSFEKFENNAWLPTSDASFDFDNNEITFNNTGKYRVLFQTNSGNQLQFEKTRSYEFTINDGINVNSWESLKSTLETNYSNSKPINILVLEEDDIYGYSLVPTVLKGENPTGQASTLSISVADKDVNINGNNFLIDMTNSKGFTGEADLFNISATTKSINVNINDLKVSSSASINEKSIHKHGFMISGTGQVIYLNMDNIYVSGFYAGMRLKHILNGKVSNVNVENNYSNGIESSANIIEFNNMTYGLNGAFGLELVPDGSGEAGIGFDQNQKVRFSGYINSTNAHDGETAYLNTLQVNGITVPIFMQSLLQGASPEVLSNVLKDGKMHFTIFIFNDITTQTANLSTFEYVNPDGGGFINFSALNGVNTQHQYIILDLNASGFQLGKSIMYNWNYSN